MRAHPVAGLLKTVSGWAEQSAGRHSVRDDRRVGKFVVRFRLQRTIVVLQTTGRSTKYLTMSELVDNYVDDLDRKRPRH